MLGGACAREALEAGSCAASSGDGKSPAGILAALPWRECLVVTPTD